MEPRKKIYDSMLELIGNTPMVRLNKIPAGTGSEILVKLEYMNPSGSLKDRIALEMIRGAAERGELKPGATIIESSNRQHRLRALSVGRMLGYNVTIYETMPGKAGAENRR
jgi:cysteine synthase